MLGFVTAAGIKFTPCIKAGFLWAEHDKIFVLITKSALVIGWVVCLAPGYDLPIYCVCNFLLRVVWFAFLFLNVVKWPLYLDLKGGSESPV